jgi:hypothetical protein
MLMPLSMSHFVLKRGNNGSELCQRLFSVRKQIAFEFRILDGFYRAVLDAVFGFKTTESTAWGISPGEEKREEKVERKRCQEP